MPDGDVDVFGEPDRFFERDFQPPESEQDAARDVDVVNLLAVLEKHLVLLYEMDVLDGAVHGDGLQMAIGIDCCFARRRERHAGDVVDFAIVVQRLCEIVEVIRLVFHLEDGGGIGREVQMRIAFFFALE